MPKTKNGRPTIMTPEVIAKLEEAFEWGCTDKEAALHANIAVETLYKYTEREPKFLQRKLALKQTPILKARKAVVDRLARDPELSLKFLERKKKDEFSVKTETDLRVKEMPKPILELPNVHQNDSHKKNNLIEQKD